MAAHDCLGNFMQCLYSAYLPTHTTGPIDVKKLINHALDYQLPGAQQHERASKAMPVALSPSIAVAAVTLLFLLLFLLLLLLAVITDVFGRVYDVNGEAAIDDVSVGSSNSSIQCVTSSTIASSRLSDA